MILTPLDNYVLLEEAKLNDVVKSTILLDETVNMERPIMATVVKCGPLVTKVKVGEQVLFHYHMFTDILLDKQALKIGKDEGIIGIYAENA